MTRINKPANWSDRLFENFMRPTFSLCLLMSYICEGTERHIAYY